MSGCPLSLNGGSGIGRSASAPGGGLFRCVFTQPLGSHLVEEVFDDLGLSNMPGDVGSQGNPCGEDADSAIDEVAVLSGGDEFFHGQAAFIFSGLGEAFGDDAGFFFTHGLIPSVRCSVVLSRFRGAFLFYLPRKGWS